MRSRFLVDEAVLQPVADTYTLIDDMLLQPIRSVSFRIEMIGVLFILLPIFLANSLAKFTK